VRSPHTRASYFRVDVATGVIAQVLRTINELQLRKKFFNPKQHIDVTLSRSFSRNATRATRRVLVQEIFCRARLKSPATRFSLFQRFRTATIADVRVILKNAFVIWKHANDFLLFRTCFHYLEH